MLEERRTKLRVDRRCDQPANLPPIVERTAPADALRRCRKSNCRPRCVFPYGKPSQMISIDIALRRAVEGRDPAEQLRILQDMRSRYVAQLEAPIEITAEVLEVSAPV
jgi:hypothetical protein